MSTEVNLDALEERVRRQEGPAWGRAHVGQDELLALIGTARRKPRCVQAILDAAFHWAEARDLGPQSAAKAWAGLVNAAGATLPRAWAAQPSGQAHTFARADGILSFDPGSLHRHADGSGRLVVPEEAFTLEDDRDESPDGPQGSVHWVARFDASEMAALRHFLGGPARPTDDDSAPQWMLCESRRPWAVNSLRARAAEMRQAEKRCRNAFRQDWMGEPARYVADALGEAASALEAKLATIDAACVHQTTTTPDEGADRG